MGYQAGLSGQQGFAVAVGYLAANSRQGASAVAIGTQAGQSNQVSNSVAIGVLAANISQGASAVAIGNQAGRIDQGSNAIAIGNLAGSNAQTANSIVLNASSVALNAAQAGFFVRPVRTDNTQTQALGFNPTTNEIVQSKGIGILISNVTATTVSVTSNTFGTYYNITNSGFNGITLPASVPTVAGAYWLFRNNTNTTLSITYTNNGTAITNPQSVAPFSSQTVACSGTGGSSDGYILF
jgi:hypothetical protein